MKSARLICPCLTVLLMFLLLFGSVTAMQDSKRTPGQDRASEETRKLILREIVATERAKRVAAQAPTRSLVRVLFTGPCATEKAVAAERLAQDLGSNLYRVDLGSIVSKYIGETEKNLRRVLQTAEARHSVLFFDEADALFGKRSEVKDSHDRYANLQASNILQRIEEYRGLAILVTHHKDNIDKPFLRRVRYMVSFCD